MKTSGHKESRSFLECIGDSFLTQVIEETAWVHALLDIRANKEELLRNVKAGGSLGCSEHGMVEFGMLRREEGKKQDRSPELQESRI